MPILSPRRSKIAALPHSVRTVLNEMMKRGDSYQTMAGWLKSQPDVVKGLAKRFGGAPVTSCNLTTWRQTGFQDWLKPNSRGTCGRKRAVELSGLLSRIQEGAKNLAPDVAISSAALNWKSRKVAVIAAMCEEYKSLAGKLPALTIRKLLCKKYEGVPLGGSGSKARAFSLCPNSLLKLFALWTASPAPAPDLFLPFLSRGRGDVRKRPNE